MLLLRLKLWLCTVKQEVKMSLKHTFGVPQSHSSSLSRMPLPHLATEMMSSWDGGFLKHAPPPLWIKLSKFFSLQLLNLVAPLHSHPNTTSRRAGRFSHKPPVFSNWGQHEMLYTHFTFIIICISESNRIFNQKKIYEASWKGFLVKTNFC